MTRTENTASALQNIGDSFAKWFKSHEADFQALINADRSHLTVKDVAEQLCEDLGGSLDSMFLITSEVFEVVDHDPLKRAFQEAA